MTMTTTHNLTYLTHKSLNALVGRKTPEREPKAMYRKRKSRVYFSVRIKEIVLLALFFLFK